MELFNVLNEMEELVEGCPRVPLTRRVLVDEDKLLDLVDRIRTSLPEEVRQAKWVIQEREKVINDSRKEADRLLDDAQRETLRKADESEITKQARNMAEDIVRRAEDMSAQIKEGARDYADEIMGHLEKNLARMLTEVQDGRVELQGMKKG